MAEDGVGSMHHKRFWADIAGSRFHAAQLMTIFKEKITDVMPIEFAAEPGVPTKVEAGVTLTGALPMRGNIQIRVEVSEPARVVFGTVEGHPLAGIVEFTTKDSGGGVQFAIDTYTRAATTLDEVQAHLPVASCCGCCEQTARELIQTEVQAKSSPVAA